MKHYILLVVILLGMASCSNYKDIPYFQNSAQFDGSQGAFLYDMTIKPKDKLVIMVTSPSFPEATAAFRVRWPASLNNARQVPGGVQLSMGVGERSYYLVNNEGNIEFPVLGKINIAGKTIEQANQMIKEKVAPYIKEGVDFQVNTYIRNYEISVLGEVKNPNTFEVGRNRCTVLEALAMAGDMTIYGKRNNVKVLRELPNGEYDIHELDLRDANILNSPYYYLQQRDILYVEPNEAMAQNAKLGRTRQLWVRGISISIALGSLLYRVIK